ncbi:MAG: type III pantothenate kinase [Alphaproteobacteria bacterium]|nr:type III pantothenate kinase [Alphaproteobacteria bacterium]
MLLAIDSGNTNTVFALYDGDALLGVWRCANDPMRTADEYAVWLTQLMALKGIPQSEISDCIIASVVPQGLFNLISLCERYFGGHPLVVGEEGVDLGFKVLIDRPEQVGADRLVNVVSAYSRYGGPAILIDFGTATTFEVVDADGNYCGGVIAPGINLSAEALHMASAQLPRIRIEPTDEVIGKATVPAMKSGIFWGYISMIEGLVGRIRKEYGAEMKVVATGGLASLFAEATDVIDHTDRELTIRGLLEVFQRNSNA